MEHAVHNLRRSLQRPGERRRGFRGDRNQPLHVRLLFKNEEPDSWIDIVLERARLDRGHAFQPRKSLSGNIVHEARGRRNAYASAGGNSGQPNESVLHSAKFAIADKHGTIRDYYGAENDDAVAHVTRVVGERGLEAMQRLMGLLLTAIAVEMFLRGLREFVRG